MDQLDEKKWFIYFGDRHEGPFSIEELRSKVKSQTLTSSHYAWCDGMPDWKVISELPSLISLFQSGGAGSVPPPPGSSMGSSSVFDSTLFLEEPTGYAVSAGFPPESLSSSPRKTASAPNVDEEKEREVKVKLASIPVANIEIEPEELPKKTPSAKPKRTFTRTLLFLILFLGIGGGAAYYFISKTMPMQAESLTKIVNRKIEPFLLDAVNQYPVLSKWVSPIPRLEELTDAENEELQDAARAQVSERGPVASMVISSQNAMSPIVYLATNLPDGANFELWIRGVRGKIIGTPSIETKVNLRTTRRLAKSEALQAPGGAPLPKGEYVLYLTESLDQPPPVQEAFGKSKVPPVRGVIPEGLPKDRKMLVSKSAFLGGKRDANYASQLKEYLERANLIAQTELKDLKDVQDFLSSQLEITESAFKAHSKTPKKAQSLKGWSEANKKWTRAKAMRWDSKLPLWTPQAIQNDFIYGKLFELALAIGSRVEQIHQMASKPFLESANPKEIEKELSVSTKEAHESIKTFEAKILEMEKQGPGPDGLPRKDGQ